MTLPRQVRYQIDYQRKGELVISDPDELDTILEGRQLQVSGHDGKLMRAIMVRAEFVLIDYDE